MPDNAIISTLSPKQREAVDLLVLDELSDEVIAAHLKINPATLYRWKKIPEFKESIQLAVEEIAANIRLQTIATKQFRIDALAKRWEDLETIRTKRKDDPELSKFPGSPETGFVTAELKLVKIVDKTGDEGTTIRYREFWSHSFDSSLFNAYLAAEKQMAQETGQWEDKLSVEGTLKREYIIVDDGVEIPNDVPIVEGEVAE